MYMGELTRQVLVDMVLEGLMFSNINVEPLLQKQGSFPTRFLSEIESDPVVSSIFSLQFNMFETSSRIYCNFRVNFHAAGVFSTSSLDLINVCPTKTVRYDFDFHLYLYMYVFTEFASRRHE